MQGCLRNLSLQMSALFAALFQTFAFWHLLSLELSLLSFLVPRNFCLYTSILCHQNWISLLDVNCNETGRRNYRSARCVPHLLLCSSD
jgi:hypothetical protein